MPKPVDDDPANDTQGTLDDFLGDVAPPKRRIDPGRAALLAMQPAENRAALEEYFSRHDAARSRGKAAHTSGDAGESWVEEHHARAIEEGLAVRIEHVGAPWVPHIVGGRAQRDSRGRILGAVVDVAPPDYLGCLADGRHLAVEAKRRHGRLHAPLSDDELAEGLVDVNAIERHQAEYLAAVAHTPAVALVVVTFVRRQRGEDYESRHAVPWRVLAMRWRSARGGRLSVGPEELDDYTVRGDCYLARFCEAS